MVKKPEEKQIVKKTVGKKKVVKKTKIEPIGSPTKIPIKWKGNQVLEEKYKGNFLRIDVKKNIQQKSNDLKAKGFDGKISIAVKYDGLHWISGYFTDIGDDIV